MLKLTIEMDNAAFADDCAAELAHLLRQAARCIEDGYPARTLIDSNGNCVGSYHVSGDIRDTLTPTLAGSVRA